MRIMDGNHQDCGALFSHGPLFGEVAFLGPTVKHRSFTFNKHVDLPMYMVMVYVILHKPNDLWKFPP
jgi:hypothetical protein